MPGFSITVVEVKVPRYHITYYNYEKLTGFGLSGLDCHYFLLIRGGWDLDSEDNLNNPN